MLTLIIGLPGSGKTYMLNQLEKVPNQFIYDDAIPNIPYNDFYSRLSDLSNSVYLADPRLCDYPTFKRVVDRLPSNIQSTMQLILFENNPEACIRNVTNDRRIRDIQTYSKHYDIELYLEWHHTINEIVNEAEQLDNQANHHNNH